MNYLIINTSTNKVTAMASIPTNQDKELFLEKNPGLVLRENRENFSKPIGYLWNSATDEITQVDNVALYQQLFGEPIPNRTTTIKQLRLALLQQGKLDQLNQGIDAIQDSTARARAKIEWEYGITIAQESPFTQTLMQILGLNTEEMQQLFAAANGFAA